MTATSPPLLSGPVLPPLSGTARSLVVFLHGYGSDGADLISIGRLWAKTLPDTVFAAPHAPDPCEVFGAGYQWFSLRAAEGIPTGAFDSDDMAIAPAKRLDDYLDALLAQWGLPESRLAVVGFSQGAMMAMYAMPRRKTACAGVLAYSGLLVAPAGLKAQGIVKMPVLAIHGQEDDVVRPSCLEHVAAGFDAAGFNVETVLRPRLGHGIDDFGLTRGADFLQEIFENNK